MRNLLLLTILGIPAAVAQSALPPNPPALQSAVKGIGKALQRPAHAVKPYWLADPPPPKACSVPMPMMKPEDGASYPIRRVPRAPVTKMPQAQVPAPPCETRSAYPWSY